MNEFKCLVCNEKLNGDRRKFCDNKCASKFKYQKNKKNLNKNTYARQIAKYRYRKFKLIELRGNKGCEYCGYFKNISALDFHHIDPSTKNFQLDGRTLSNRSWEQILIEFNKCEILCSNCHREKHNPDLYFDKRDDYAEISEKEKKLKYCIDCNIEIDIQATRCVKCNSYNKRKIERPTKNKLLIDVKLLGYSAVGRKYGVSDNTIRKWLK